ncbi:hypothetical protein AB0K16_22065 [Nonomuraea jabiensis]|uniref:hypothetical protein n=1 Tax=Nonomuraea jabiensis TaxID=882448 RepID=UPI00341D147A
MSLSLLLGTPSEISKAAIDELEEYIKDRGYDYNRAVIDYGHGVTRQALNFFFTGLPKTVYIHVISYQEDPYLYTVYLIDEREATKHVGTIGAVNTPSHAMTLHSLAVNDHFTRNRHDYERCMAELRKAQFVEGRAGR